MAYDKGMGWTISSPLSWQSSHGDDRLFDFKWARWPSSSHSNKDDNHGMGRHGRGLDSDDDKKEDEQKEGRLANQRACVIAEGGGDRA
jgi:hypothetical protein